MLLALQPGHLGIARTARTATRRRPRTSDVVAIAPTTAALTDTAHRPGTPGFAHWAAAVGQRIDERGLAAAVGEVDELVAVARGLAVALVAADVLADPTQPEPARYRAFAHVVSALVTPPAA